MGRSDYLEFGGAAAAEAVDQEAAREYLVALGFGNGDLGQARAAIEARHQERFAFDAIGSRYCDFCFAPIMGGEYEELQDGRDRCTRCSRTVLSTHEQFVREFEYVRRKLELAFSISINAPTRVRMVNAKEIAKRTGESFVPSSGVDPRVLGYAEKSDQGIDLYIESGSPRQAAVTTMAHELTHIWQFANWPDGAIETKYGKRYRLVVAEGMATWAMVQYLYFAREFDFARRQEAYALEREDEYGIGFRIYCERYPLATDGQVSDDNPFATPFPL